MKDTPPPTYTLISTLSITNVMYLCIQTQRFQRFRETASQWIIYSLIKLEIWMHTVYRKPALDNTSENAKVYWRRQKEHASLAMKAWEQRTGLTG